MPSGNANAGSMRTSHSTGLTGHTGADEDLSSKPEERVIAGVSGIERAPSGTPPGYQGDQNGPNKPVGQGEGDTSDVTSSGSSATGTHGGSSVQNPAGHGGGHGHDADPGQIAAEMRAEQNTPSSRDLNA